MPVYDANGTMLADLSNDSAKPYVKAEADRVAALVRSVQTDKTLTIVSISDLHYRDDVPEIKDAIEDMSAAIGVLHSQIHTDYDVSYGDVIYAMWAVDGRTDRVSYADGVTDMVAAEKLQHSGFGLHPQIRLVGNHDMNADDSSGNKWFGMNMLYGFFGAYSEVLDKPESYRNRSYGYIDDEYRKLRIICLNTSDFGSGSPNKGAYGNLNYYMSAEQTQWLINALDLSGKSDADQWQIILMSHVPFDQSSTHAPANGGMIKNGYPNLLQAYEVGGSGTLNGQAYDFSGGKNAAKLALYIHGHTHAYTVDNQHYQAGSSGNYSYPRMKLARICVPNALPGRDTGASATSDVGIAWGNGETYPKTANTKDSTAFVVNTIDPVNMVIYSHHYGAGLDRILHYDSETVSGSKTLTPSITATSWVSLDTSIATVSNGVVTPVANGNVMVYARAADGTREYWNLAVSV